MRTDAPTPVSVFCEHEIVDEKISRSVDSGTQYAVVCKCGHGLRDEDWQPFLSIAISKHYQHACDKALEALR